MPINIRRIIKEELVKALREEDMQQEPSSEESGDGSLSIPKKGKSLDAAKALADWLKSKGFKAKAYARPARRNYTLNKPPLSGGSIEPSTVIEFFPKSSGDREEQIADAKQQRREAWDLIKSEIGSSKKYKQSDNQTIEYIPFGDFIFTLDYTGLPKLYRIGVLTKKITGLKNKVEDDL
jgi:hypothetical protein